MNKSNSAILIHVYGLHEERYPLDKLHISLSIFVKLLHIRLIVQQYVKIGYLDKSLCFAYKLFYAAFLKLFIR